MRSLSRPILLALLVGGLTAACDDSTKTTTDPNPVDPNMPVGTTDFVTESTGNGTGTTYEGADSNGKAGAAPPTVAIDGAGAAGGQGARDAAPGAPAGRVAAVEEADIYRIDNDRLFYFNTYRGLIIYDLTDPKIPRQISRLGVYGYPIEMFVSGNTVFALLSDALYLTQASGKLQFERHYVSQLVAIDVSDIANPRIIKTVDIVGELREGVSRKIDNTIYVVSYISQYYYYGWGYSRGDGTQNPQAWVYSFDVSNPQEPKQVGQLQVFEGGQISVRDPNGLFSYNRNFNNVAISATSNALMVVENWYVYGYSSTGTDRNGYSGCYSSNYNSFQQSVVSIVDVSDPKGSIRRHTKFDTPGTIGDQFKMTYVFDETTQKGTFYGIFARQSWSSSSCSGSSHTANTLESWDITDGANPTLLAALDFGKPNETVRGSTFDVDRSVVYAITAQNMDPLYALSFADPKNLKVLSAVDGLSGNMNVFRLIEDKKYLLGIGQDTSSTCSGFQGDEGRQGTKMAVSIIDVRDLSRIRLVQRQCVAVKNAEWVGSEINWNLDQAHKMIGMFSDAEANVVTVPVYYWTRSDANDDWWWYQYKSAVGIMTWDISKYDDTKPETQQSVLQNFGTFIHPNGQVIRTIVFKHQATGQRMMVNLSETHASIASLQDLSQPALQSVIEVAPYYSQVFSFGNYVVTQVQSRPSYYGSLNQDLSQFRVFAAGGDLDNAPALASFSVGQVQQAVKHGNQLLLFRTLLDNTSKSYEYGSRVQVLVYDLTDPTHPRRAGTTVVEGGSIPYYPYRCGWDGYWGGYWSMGNSGWAQVKDGLVALNQYGSYEANYTNYTYSTNLLFLDLTDSDAPKVNVQSLIKNSKDWSGRFLLGDPMDPSGFYMGTYEQVGTRKGNDGSTFTQSRYYAQRWNRSGSGFVAAEKINIPGPLVRTWGGLDGTRYFMTQDSVADYVPPTSTATRGYYNSYARLNLLYQVSVNGTPAASLLDSKTFTNVYLYGLTMDGNTLYAAANQNHYPYYDIGPAGTGDKTAATWETTSARLMIFDLSQNTFASLYDQPTKAYNLSIMGANQGRLFINLSGDGVLAVDVSNPAQPTGAQFLRTLGYASTLEAVGDDLYVASGYFGLDHMSLSAPGSMPLDP